MLKRNLDVGIADIDIRGKFYTVVHGDYDLFSKSGTYNLCSMLGYFPYALISVTCILALLTKQME